MSKYTEAAPAKINLFLHVTGKRHDNYHFLYSHVAFSRDIADHLEYQKSTHPFTIEINGPFAAGIPNGPDNLVYQAAKSFCNYYNLPLTGHLKLSKHLPAGAGIGGGSSDAAAMLRLLSNAYNKPDEKVLLDMAAKLGADVPMCLKQQSAIVTGIGEQISPLPHAPESHIVLVNPGTHISTPAVFKNLKQNFNSSVTPLPVKIKSRKQYFNWLAKHTNDLSAPAEKLCQDIKSVKAALSEQSGQKYFGMSGSGATCFAIFANARDAKKAQINLQKSHPHWWVQKGTINKR